MGRQRQHRRDLPERVYHKHAAYYFVDRANKWHRLGADFHAAMIEYARLNATDALVTLGQVFDAYQAGELPKKARKTQREQTRQLALLRKTFGHMQPADVRPRHVYAYMDLRPGTAANREKALLSHVFSFAIRKGLLDRNPCREVKRNTEAPSGRYVEPAQYNAVYAVMPPAIQCAMDIALCTGLRQADVLGLRLQDCHDDGLLVETAKTKRKLLFAWTPELRRAIERARKLASRADASMAIVHNRDGQHYTSDGFRAIWTRRLRDAIADGELDPAARFQFKDLRTTAGSDDESNELLGHTSRATTLRHYKVKPLRVTPIK